MCFSNNYCCTKYKLQVLILRNKIEGVIHHSYDQFQIISSLLLPQPLLLGPLIHFPFAVFTPHFKNLQNIKFLHSFEHPLRLLQLNLSIHNPMHQPINYSIDIHPTLPYYSLTNKSTLMIYTLANNITNTTVLTLLSNYTCQILITCTNGWAYQLDFEIGKLIKSFNVGIGIYMVGWISSVGQFVSTERFDTDSTSYQMYWVRDGYGCGGTDVGPDASTQCPSCLRTNSLVNASYCQKNYTATITTPNVTANTNTTTNTTCNTTTNTTTNTTSNTTAPIAVPIAIPPPQQNQTTTPTATTQSFEQFINNLLQSEQANSTAIATSKILTFSSVRIFPKCLLVLSCFLDDLDGYQYHRTHYPTTMIQFLNKINIMNQIRFMPWFFDVLGNTTDTIRTRTNFSADWNQFYVDYYNWGWKSDPKQIYFLNAISDVYTVTLLQNITIFVVLKVLHGMFYLLRNKYRFFRVVYLKILMQTQWWTFLMTILQANMVNLAFGCATQLVNANYFNILNKINFVLMAVTLFTLFIYSLCFYSLMRQYSINSYIRILQRNIITFSRSYTIEPTYFPFRSLIRSLINGFFIGNHHLQIILLLFLDIFYTIFVFRIKNTYKNKVVYIFTLIYYISFVVLDSFILYELMTARLYLHEILRASTINSLIICSLMVFFAVLIPQVYRRFKKIKEYLCVNTQISIVNQINANMLRQNANKGQCIVPKKITMNKDKLTIIRNQTQYTKKRVVNKTINQNKSLKLTVKFNKNHTNKTIQILSNY